MYCVVKCSKTRLFCLAGNFALDDCLLFIVLHQYDIQVLSIERETWLFLFLCMTFMSTTDDAQFRQTIQMAPTILSSLHGLMAVWVGSSCLLVSAIAIFIAGETPLVVRTIISIRTTEQYVPLWAQQRYRMLADGELRRRRPKLL